MPRRALEGKPSDLLQVVLPAAARGDLAAVRGIVDADPRWVHLRGPHNRTMLWEAARKGRTETARYLLEQGADHRVRACYYSESYVDLSCLCVARVHGHDEVAQLLQDRGAKVDIHSAAYLGDRAGVAARLRRSESLLHRDVGAARGAAPSFAATPLHYAVAGSQFEVAELLVAAGAEVKKPGGMLLRWAVWRENLPLVRLLLQHGADPSESGITEWACEPEYAELAAEYGFRFDVDMPDWMGFPALVDACRGNHNAPDDPSRVAYLLEKGANVLVSDHKGKTALHRAAQAGHVRIAALLLEHGADVNAGDAGGDTPIFDAIRGGRAPMVELLASAGALLDLEGAKGKTARELLKRARRQELRILFDELG